MTGLWDYIALAAIAISIAGWMALRFVRIGPMLGVGAMLVAWFFKDIWIAVFAPFGVVLPVIAAVPLARLLGWQGKRIALLDLIILAVGLGYLLFASGGVFQWDAYRLGYDPLWGGLICLGGCLWAALRGYVPLAVAALVAQGLWLAGLGTENAWDGLSHALLLPIAVICIIRRLITHIRS